MGVTLQQAGKAAHAERVRLARRDPSVFVDGFRDPLTGGAMSAAPFQREWHELVEREPRSVIWSPVEHGKSTRFLRHTIWRMGRNPLMHGVIVGESSTAAEKVMLAIRRSIEEDPWVREVFPALRPAKGKYGKWTDTSIRIEGQVAGDQHPTLQGIGWNGTILGSRIDWVMADDLCTFTTTATALARQKVKDWWASTVEGRLVDNATVVVLGNAWFPDDVMHWLVRTAKYASLKHEAYREREDGSIDPDSILWPARFSVQSLKERGIRFGGVTEARRQLRCIAYSSGSSQFDIGWFDKGFALGEAEWRTAFGKIEPRFLPEYRPGWPTFTGVDIGVGLKSKNDQSCLFTIAVEPGTQRRFPIHVESGRWTGPQLIDRIKHVHTQYRSRILVEDNAGQDFLVQWTREKGVPVEGYTTTGRKADPRFGVPSIATELSQGMWALPAEDEIHKWRAQCLDYAPGEHVGDRLMASWFAREAALDSGYVAGETVDPGGRMTANLRCRYDIRDRRGLRRVS